MESFSPAGIHDLNPTTGAKDEERPKRISENENAGGSAEDPF